LGNLASLAASCDGAQAIAKKMMMQKRVCGKRRLLMDRLAFLKD
jgi:hypothetical protein